MSERKTLLLGILVFGLIGLVWTASQTTNPALADTKEITNNWVTAEDVSVGASYAIRPSVAAAPNGKTVIVTYSGKSGGDTKDNTYYSFSNNNGKSGSWTKNSPLYPQPDSTEESSQTNVIFDQNNKAHVVWIEGLGIAYANSTSGNLGNPFTNVWIAPNPPASDPGASNPRVVTYGNHVHIIWAEGDTSSGTPQKINPNIYHIHSSNGGATWGAVNAITFNTVKSESPAVAVDDAGNLHVVYQQQTIMPTHNNIKYAKGTFNGSAITWSTEANQVDITSKIPVGAFSMVEPSIIYSNGRLDVSVTQKYDSPNPNDDSESQQYVYHIYCKSACTNANNWYPQRASNTPLYISITPQNLASSIIRVNGCTNIIYDGKVSPGEQNDSEQVFENSSCSGWGIPNELTDNDESRSIQPAAASQNNWWIYVVYEEFTEQGDAEKIYFIRNIPGVYLPVIIRAR